MTVSVTNSLCTTKNSNQKTPTKQACQQQLSVYGEAEKYEQQEVQNLPFESAKLKAQHSHWSERCSSGIQHMLTRRQHRHDAVLQTYLDIRLYILSHTAQNIAMASTASLLGSCKLVIEAVASLVSKSHL